jgi:hypothetical protein
VCNNDSCQNTQEKTIGDNDSSGYFLKTPTIESITNFEDYLDKKLKEKYS